jgi:hypothetical protein
MTLLEVSEYIEGVVAMALMLRILVGAYLFVITPHKQREEERDTDYMRAGAPLRTPTLNISLRLPSSSSAS